MKYITVKNYDEMSSKAAEFILERVKENNSMNLGLATGGTPVGTYENLIKDHKQNGTTYKNMTTFNLDEYVGLSPEHPNSYRFYMNDLLFNHIDIPLEKTFVPKGDATDANEESVQYDNLIKKHGGVDLQILGIGTNGHIAFNEPGTSFSSRTHVIDLTKSTIEDNARYFDRIEEVPTKAVTMGIETIMESKEIVLLISGASKKETFARLVQGDVSEDFPASILKEHANVTVIVDEDAIGDTKIS